MFGTERYSRRLSRAAASGMPEKEARHFRRRTRPMRIGERSGLAAAGPGVANVMDGPLLDGGVTRRIGEMNPLVSLCRDRTFLFDFDARAVALRACAATSSPLMGLTVASRSP